MQIGFQDRVAKTRSGILALFLFLSLGFAPTTLLALQSVTLAWDPSPDADVISYNIYYGVSTGNYTNRVAVGNVTTATISNLVEGVTYFFVATAMNSSGLESDPSNEVSYTVPTASGNAPPTLNALPNLALNEDAPLQIVPLSGITSGATNEIQTLTVTAISSNPSLIPNPAVTYTSPNSTGSISFTPVPTQFGSATITVTVNDGAASNNIITKSFTVTVNPVNDLPTLNALANLVINEDAAQQTVPLTGISSGAANESQVLTVTATSSNPSLIPNPAVTYTSPNNTGSISFSPVPTQFGSATITVTVNDGATSNNIITKTFTVTVSPVNDLPTLNALANLVINEDAPQQTVALSGISSGAANESQTLTVTATSSNPSLISTPAVTYTSPNTTGSISFSPVPTQFGSATITVTVNDGAPSNNIVTKTFSVTVNPVNDLPTLNSIADLVLNEDAPQQTVTLTAIGSGAANESQTLTVTATSSNPSLIPNPAVTYTSPNPTGTITLTPVANQFGSTTITVTVNDGAASNNIVSKNFSVTVNPVNDLPTLNPLADLVLDEDAPQQTVTLTGIGSGAVNESQTLTITATSSNPSLIPNPAIAYTSPNPTGIITLTPVANQSGSATITITVNDGATSNNIVGKSFTVTVTPVNDPPTLDPITDLVLVEDTVSQIVTLTGISSGSATENQTLVLTAVSSNPTLLPNPQIAYTNPGATGNLTLRPATNAFGSATITVTVNDGGSSANVITRSFTVSITPVNDPPTLSSIPNLVLNEDAEPQTVALYGISSGAPNESQALTITATSSNPALIPDPAVTYLTPSATGTLTLTPAADLFGTAIITVTVSDGDPLNGTTTKSFSVSVNPVNDTPTLDPLSDLVLKANSGARLVALSGISAGPTNENQLLTITANSSNPSVLPNPLVTYSNGSPTGSLTLSPAANANGTALITVTVNDGQPTNNLISRSFTVTINGTNNAPTLDFVSNLTVSEDCGPQTITLTGIGSGSADENQTLTVSAVSSVPSLIPNPVVTYASPAATAQLNFTPAANGAGTVTISVTVNDGQTANNLTTRNFTITVTPVNDAPTLNPISNLTINQGSGPQTISLSGISSGAGNELQALTVTATSSNPALIPTPQVIYTSQNSIGSLIVSPLTNAYGNATITVTVNDGQAVNNTVTRTFSVTVNPIGPVNARPTINPLANLVINEDAGAQNLQLTGVTAGSNEVQSLSVSATSSNPGLIPNPQVTYTSPASTGTLSFTPVANASGTATVTLTVNDGQAVNNTATTSFTVTVNPVNDAPTLDAIGNLSLAQGSTTQNVNLTGISSGATNENQTLTVTAISSNPSLVPNPSVSYTSPNAVGSLSLTPLASASGSATITVTVNDGQTQNGTFSRSFVVTVNPVNAAPTLNAIANLSVDEDAGSQTVSLTGISSGSPSESQTLTVSASSSNPALIPHPNVTYSTPATSATLAFTPAANGFGTATITVTVNDGQVTNNTTSRSFVITVNPVNDAPTLNPLADLLLPQGAASRTVNLSGIGTGASNEIQSLTVTAVSSNPSLVPNPTVTYATPAATGSLSITPAADAFGTALITVTVSDGQAQNSISTRTFNVVVNGKPSISSIVDVVTAAGTSTAPLAFSVSDPESPASSLVLTAESSNPAILPSANIVIGGAGTNRTAVLTPATNQTGVVTVTLTVSDGLSSTQTSFLLDVQNKPNPPSGLLVVTEGSGTVSPAYSKSTMVSGKSYKVTATPNPGYVFAGWSGTVSSTSPKISFVMGPSVTLKAKFVKDPYQPLQGTYAGLFYESDEIRQRSAGSFTLSITPKGMYTGRLQLGAGRYAFKGKLSTDGTGTNLVGRAGAALGVSFQIDTNSGLPQVTGQVSGNGWTSPLSGVKGAYGARGPKAPLAGSYTFVLPGSAGDSSSPAGHGYATLKIMPSGAVKLAGSLADGTKITLSAPVSSDANLPLYIPLYRGAGSLVSWLNISRGTDNDVSGLVNWFKPGGQLTFPQGVNVQTDAIGSFYVPAGTAGKVLPTYLGQISFSGGPVETPFANKLVFGATVSNQSANPLKISFALATGAFKGKVTDPVTGTVRSFTGVVLQKQVAGYGYTLNGASSAALEITPLE